MCAPELTAMTQRSFNRLTDQRWPCPPTVIISARGEERLRGGHPWIYRADVADVRAAAGDIVQVRSPRGQTIGSALFSDQSQITLRVLTHGEQHADEALLRRRLETAIAFRGSLAIDATAYRLVHGEADLLPSLIVDRYGEYLVVQALSQGMDRLLPAVVAPLTDLAAAARHPRAKRPACARTRRAGAAGRGAGRRGAGTGRR